VEKRFALFLVLSALILVGHLTLQSFLAPVRPDRPQDAEDLAEIDQPEPLDQQLPVEGGVDPDEPTAAPPVDQPPELAAGEPAAVTPSDPVDAQPTQPQVDRQWVTLGSMEPGSPYRLLVILCNQGAAVERIELVERTRSGRFRFLHLDDPAGYLGYLAMRRETGCRVNVVPPGSPAAVAKPARPGLAPGLRAGDVIQQIDSQAVETPDDLQQILAATEPGQTVELQVLRTGEQGASATEMFAAVLTERPLSIVDRETNPDSPGIDPDQLSLLFSLESVGPSKVPRGRDEFADLPSLRDSNWQIELPEGDPAEPVVEFRFRLSPNDLQAIDQSGELELVKRYRLAVLPAEARDDSLFPAYHLALDLEIRNAGSQEQQVAFRLDGPTGLPIEGWWYSNKIHPRFMAAAGARDVVWNTPEGGRGLIGGSQIYKETKEAEEKNQAPAITLFAEVAPQPVEYIGVDTQYFAVVLQSDLEDEPSPTEFQQALAIAAGEVGEKKKSRPKTTNATFRLISQPLTIPPGGAYTEHFTVFSGPKQPALLEAYGLERVIEYGWFRPIARLLAAVLHFFESLPLVNYGLAIILLTVLVRSCMIPLSRKATKNAQMMQELAPEMKRIAEKYKNDMEKRSAAQRELFAKNNYNPFGGCLLMFIQLPIFIGLYRALSVDVELRQAPLIPGMSWCSNLAGPDMLWYWEPYLPAFLAGETGWLGPYLNVLPIVTIILFLLQQKMFMPPATDDQTRMQQQMMKFMMVFMGVLFFRVPSGLCVYFIASSLWGLAERKLLPPVGKQPAAGGAAATVEQKKAGPSPTKKLALFADRLSAKLGADTNVRTAKSKRKPRKGH
jgi:YidC/Oxa1 family membrane protein insertase